MGREVSSRSSSRFPEIDWEIVCVILHGEEYDSVGGR